MTELEDFPMEIEDALEIYETQLEILKIQDQGEIGMVTIVSEDMMMIVAAKVLKMMTGEDILMIIEKG